MHTPDKNRPWHYTSIDGQNIGPVSFEILREAANKGLVNRSTAKAWCDQLSDWILISEITGIYDSPPPPPLSDNHEQAVAPQASKSPSAKHKKINIPLMTIAYWLGIALQVIGILLIVGALTVWAEDVKYTTEDYDTGEIYDSRTQSEPNKPALVLGIVITLIALIPSIYFGVMAMLTIYRSWGILPQSARRTSPGKALCFLFIPLFNYYWIFQAFFGFSKDYEAWRSKNAPQVSKNLFLMHCIFTCTFFVPGFLITTILVYRRMAEVHNWHTETDNQRPLL